MAIEALAQEGEPIMSEPVILIVEDEDDIAELLAYNLQRNRYQTIIANTGEEGLDQALTMKPNLVLLDLMLPGLGGLDVCRQLKGHEPSAQIPVVMLTAKGEEEDIIAGFAAGADDYITKPFRPKVLLARVKAVLRRGPAKQIGATDILEIGALSIHPGRHQVTADNEILDLTRTEFRILHFLASRPGWVFTRTQIVRAVHGDDYPVTGRSVDVQIAALRRKLGVHGAIVQTVRGVGYKIGD